MVAAVERKVQAAGVARVEPGAQAWRDVVYCRRVSVTQLPVGADGDSLGKECGPGADRALWQLVDLYPQFSEASIQPRILLITGYDRPREHRLGRLLAWRRKHIKTHWIQTVQGDVKVESLGLILPHEHLFTDLRGPHLSNYAHADPEVVAQVMAPYLEAAHAAGVTALVECSTVGVGRNVAVLRRLAEITPIHIVAPTGVYREEFVPASLRETSAEELAEAWIQDLTQGIGGTEVRARFIKIAVSDDGITALEVRNLKAAALWSPATQPAARSCGARWTSSRPRALTCGALSGCMPISNPTNALIYKQRGAARMSSLTRWARNGNRRPNSWSKRWRSSRQVVPSTFCSRTTRAGTLPFNPAASRKTARYEVTPPWPRNSSRPCAPMA